VLIVGTTGEPLSIADRISLSSLFSKRTSTGLILVISVRYFVLIESSSKAPTKHYSVVTSKNVNPKLDIPLFRTIRTYRDSMSKGTSSLAPRLSGMKVPQVEIL